MSFACCISALLPQTPPPHPLHTPTPKIFHIPYEEQKYRGMADGISKDAAECDKALRRIRHQHPDVEIDLSYTQDKMLTVNIRGKRSDVSATKATVLRDLQTQVRGNLNKEGRHV
jgi:hypothetical protein